MVDIVDVYIDSAYMNKDINCDDEHTQPQGNRCNFEVGVLGG